MSCYEWEHGEIIIPTDQWAGFKKTLREAYNSALARDLEQAANAVARVKAERKGKRNTDWRAALQAEIHANDRHYHHYSGEQLRPRYHFEVIYSGNIVNGLLAHKERTAKDGTKSVSYTLGTLKKKNFPQATSKTMQFAAGAEATLTLNDQKRSVIWNVPENNNACEHARESFMGATLFEALGKITWRRNSGGCLTGNDEYHGDSKGPGEGENFIKDCFGPLGTKIHEEYVSRLRGGFRTRRRRR